MHLIPYKCPVSHTLGADKDDGFDTFWATPNDMGQSYWEFAVIIEVASQCELETLRLTIQDTVMISYPEVDSRF